MWIQNTKRLEERSQNGGNNGTTPGRYLKESEEIKIEALKRGLRAKEMYGEYRTWRDNAPSPVIFDAD